MVSYNITDEYRLFQLFGEKSFLGLTNDRKKEINEISFILKVIEKSTVVLEKVLVEFNSRINVIDYNYSFTDIFGVIEYMNKDFKITTTCLLADINQMCKANFYYNRKFYDNFPNNNIDDSSVNTFLHRSKYEYEKLKSESKNYLDRHYVLAPKKFTVEHLKFWFDFIIQKEILMIQKMNTEVKSMKNNYNNPLYMYNKIDKKIINKDKSVVDIIAKSITLFDEYKNLFIEMCNSELKFGISIKK